MELKKEWNTKLELVWICFAMLFKFVSEVRQVDPGSEIVTLNIIIAGVFVLISSMVITAMLYFAKKQNSDSISETHLFIVFGALFFNYESCHSLNVDLAGIFSLLFTLPIGLLIWFYNDKRIYNKILDYTLSTLYIVIVAGFFGLCLTIVFKISNVDFNGALIFFPISTTSFSGLLIGLSIGIYLNARDKGDLILSDNCCKFLILRFIVALFVGMLCAYFFPYGWVKSSVDTTQLKGISVILSFTYAVFLPLPIIIYLLNRVRKGEKQIFESIYFVLVLAVLGGMLQASATIIARSIYSKSSFNWAPHYLVEISSSIMLALAVIFSLPILQSILKSIQSRESKHKHRHP